MTEAENKVRLARQLVRAAIEMLEIAMMEPAGSLSREALNRVDPSLSGLRDISLGLLSAESHELAKQEAR